LDGGWTLRRMSYPYLAGGIQSNGNVITAEVNPRTLHGLGYLQQASSFFEGKLHLLGSLRYDQSERYPDHPLSPQASMALQLARATTVQLGYAHYVQNNFPPNIGQPGTCPEESQGWRGRHTSRLLNSHATQVETIHWLRGLILKRCSCNGQEAPRRSPRLTSIRFPVSWLSLLSRP